MDGASVDTRRNLRVLLAFVFRCCIDGSTVIHGEVELKRPSPVGRAPPPIPGSLYGECREWESWLLDVGGLGVDCRCFGGCRRSEKETATPNRVRAQSLPFPFPHASPSLFPCSGAARTSSQHPPPRRKGGPKMSSPLLKRRWLR